MKLLKTIRGSVMLEAALTLPIVVYIMLYSLELLHMNRMQTAIDAIAEKCTIDYIANHDSTKFEEIINQYLSASDQANLSYSFTVYESIEKMQKTPPYGGADIYWPEDITSYIPSSSESRLDAVGYIVDNVKEPEKTQAVLEKIPGCAFVLTFVFNYKFYSHLTSTFFSGGTNTADKKKYLLWSRGVGICEYKCKE